MTGETLIVSRGSTDAMANRTTRGTHPVRGVFSWGTYSADHDRRESASTTTELYVPRDADVQARDRITRSNGQIFAVVGSAQWDQASPHTGHDFGWKLFTVESVNG